MCVIAEKKKLQLNSTSLYVVVIFIIGGILIGGAQAPWAPPPPLVTPMILPWICYQRPVETAPIFKILLLLKWYKHE